MEQAPKLLDQVRERIRFKHYSIRTERSYIGWIRRFILFHGKRHPQDMGAPEVEAFLTHLAAKKNVAVSTQNQAFSALLFLYRDVLGQQLDAVQNVERARKPAHLPVVLTGAEIHAVLAHLDGMNWLMASLLYGAGLRLMECVRLRIKDVEFSRGEILVRDGKGAKDRVTMLPEALLDPLAQQIRRTEERHRQDLASGQGPVPLGHSDVRTTMIYTHVLNRGGKGVRSPLDTT